MRLPKHFLIKGHKWTTVRKKNLKLDGHECNGITDPEKRIVYVDSRLKGTLKEWTFWHEFGHAVLWESGVIHNGEGLPSLVEELICDAFAEAFMKDKTVKFKRRGK